ncbi:MAG TPA: hypothetical protein VF903_08725 [Nitrospirota bacterium]
MKKTFFAATIAFIIITLTGCGGGGGSSAPPTFTTQILSNAQVDGDIAFSSPPPTYTFAQANITQNVFVGINPAASGIEYRGFLDFPLTGAGGVPGNAIIVSAVLDIFINNILPTTGSVPIRIQLVSLLLPSLSSADFTSTPLATTDILFPIIQADFNNHVAIDVTSLMVQAQSLGLPDFQIRILLDASATSGLIEINDTTTNRALLAPLLTVTYQ